jgi:hypothetical protein
MSLLPTRSQAARLRGRLALLGLLFAGSPACSSDDPDSPQPSAGANGGGGSGGQSAMSGGTGGDSTTAGSGGSASGSGGQAAVGAGGSGGQGSTVDSGTATGTGGAASDAGMMSDAGGASCADGDGKTEHFSFFVTSLAGLRRLSKSQNGFGGDLRFGHDDGLSGADEICRQLAADSSPGAGCKTWRAFLSVTKDKSGKPVNAKDRIGEGPWYDRRGRLVAMNKTDLLQDWPVGADPIIATDLPNEFGVPNHDPDGTGEVDNHNTITGTNADGDLADSDWYSTCHDWTSSVGEDGEPVIGFSWKGGAAEAPGSGWYFGFITEGGCAPIINLTDDMDFSIRGIGARGGYGGFYCMALEP